MFRLKDLVFAVDRQRSELFAYVPQEPPGVESPGRLRWSLELYCLDQENEQGIAAPSLSADELPLDVADWRSLDGAVLGNDGEQQLAAYLSDGLLNESTTANLLRFSLRNGSLLAVEWQCLARVFTLDGDSQPWPVQVTTEIMFSGVHLWWVKADAQGMTLAKSLVGRHFDLACLREPHTAGPYHIVFPPDPTASRTDQS
jgi:hypothetical protein